MTETWSDLESESDSEASTPAPYSMRFCGTFVRRAFDAKGRYLSDELRRFATEIDLDAESRLSLRVAFGVACVERVEHFLTEDSIVESLAIGKSFVAGCCDCSTLQSAADAAANAASSHPGSGSLDGTGNAAVSVSHAVAAALAGRALEAAAIAAYASVYSYASHAVTDPKAYEIEHAWQLRKLEELAG